MSNLTDTIRKLHSFRKLEVGWRFGYGGPPSDDLISRVERYLQKAAAWGIEVSDVFTGSDREILVGFYRGNDDIEITFEADGRVTLAEDKNGNQVDFVENISEADIYRRIWTFQFPPPVAIYAQSIRETSMRRTADLTALHLSLRAMAVESQSSTATAQSRLVERYANTSADSIQPSPSYPVSFGVSPITLCLTDA